MKTGLYISMVLVLLATQLQARETYNMNARWTFFTGIDTETDGASTIYLPHTWNNDAAAAGNAYYRGQGNYAKDIDIPAEWKGKRVFLRIGGAATVADVFVGNRFAGDHHGGQSAFTMEITGLLRFGESNNFRIVVNNAAGFDVMPTAGEENVYGGIFRSVELIVCNPLSISPTSNGGDGVFISPVKITDNRADITVRLELLDMAAKVPAGARANVRVLDADENVVAQNSLAVTGNTSLSMPLTIQKPRLWQGTADPYLYNVEVMIVSNDSVVTDSMVVRTGLRTVAVDNKNKIVLNGRPMKLRGVVLHRDRMMVGTALTPLQIEEDVALIREMGATAVRVVGGQHHNYFYDLCDEAGIMVWNDGPFTGTAYPTDIDFVNTERFKTNGKEQLSEMITQLYNHPSVIMWGLFSDVSTQGDSPVEYIRELNTLARTLDPTRLTVGSSVQNGEINFVTDLILFNQSFGWGSGRPDAIKVWAEGLAKGWPHLRAGLSYSAGGSIYHQSERLEKTNVMSNHHPEGWQTYFHEEYMKNVGDSPQFWGIFVGDMFDFGAARNTWGDGRGINNRGLVTFDRKDRKDAFWLYKALWNTTEPFVYIAGKRLDVRTRRRQAIKVYSNQAEVELLLGGRSMGKKTGTNGIFVWDAVDLRTGINRLQARSGVVTDRATITLDPTIR